MTDYEVKTDGTSPRIVVMGASAGGPEAVSSFLSRLPGNFAVPLVLVQHRAASSEGILLSFLQKATHLLVCEPLDKERISPGRLHVAPAGYHLLMEAGHFALSTEEPVLHARPSIDVLFESAALACGAAAAGILFTGASADGARGLAAIKSRGGLALVQDPATAEAPTMPLAALEACVPDVVAEPDELARALVRLLG